ncbi:hypothetical protein [Falsiroseomonas sp. HW251]|uniref:hypothetical protein n=1 Tax=Falsiroseomonas sp. HW251 TaxID=3390998 RepID=UPI003D31EFE0
MSATTPGLRARLATRWTETKPMLTGLIIGLVAGPIISGFAGFQVRTSTAEAATRSSVVEQQAAFCAERARAATPGSAALDWQARGELARRFATMPGAAAGSADQEVAYACANRLSR